MTKQRVINTVNRIVNEMRSHKKWVPRDTGNMADHALIITVTDKLIDISVDPSIAPYVSYTNEPWIAERWNNKKNPNEGWWERFAAEFARRLAKKLRGELK